MTRPTQTITFAGRDLILTAGGAARFRWQRLGGTAAGLLTAETSFYHAVLLVHALLDAAGRAKYPTPEELADDLEGDDGDAVIAAAGTVAMAAGWLPSREQVEQAIRQAARDLGTPEA